MKKLEAESPGNAAESPGNEAELAGHQFCHYQIWNKRSLSCLMPYQAPIRPAIMVCNLPSRVFSSDTLVAGVNMVERAEGLPDDKETQQLLEELQRLEAQPTLGLELVI